MPSWGMLEASNPGPESVTCQSQHIDFDQNGKSRGPADCGARPVVEWGTYNGKVYWFCVEHSTAHGGIWVRLGP